MNKTTEQPKVKTVTLKIHEVEKDALIVNIDGWRIRLYFAEGAKNTFNAGQTVEASYTGDIEDVHSLKFLPIK